MKKLILLSLCLLSCEKEKQPKIGEKRIYNIMLSIEPNNPFMTGDTVEVREVKSGYVDNSSIECFNRYTRKIE